MSQGPKYVVLAQGEQWAVLERTNGGFYNAFALTMSKVSAEKIAEALNK